MACHKPYGKCFQSQPHFFYGWTRRLSRKKKNITQGRRQQKKGQRKEKFYHRHFKTFLLRPRLSSSASLKIMVSSFSFLGQRGKEKLFQLSFFLHLSTRPYYGKKARKSYSFFYIPLFSSSMIKCYQQH